MGGGGEEGGGGGLEGDGGGVGGGLRLGCLVAPHFWHILNMLKKGPHCI